MLTMFSCVFLLAVSDPSPYGFRSQCEKNPQLIPTTSNSSTKSPGKMGGQTRPFTHCKLHEVQKRIWEVTYYPTINSVELLVRTRSIFPWLVRVVSDWSVRYNGKHPWSHMKVCPTISVSGIGYSAATNPITTFFENKRFSSFLPNGPYPGYQRFFSRAVGMFGVGRRPTHLRP